MVIVGFVKIMIGQLFKQRFKISLGIASILGIYIGSTFHYQGLFVTDADLYPLLIIPSVIIGLISGWKTIISCGLLYLLVSSIFFIRAIIGRAIQWEYIKFSFSLTVGSVIGIIPLALLSAYCMVVIVAVITFIYKKLIAKHDFSKST
ncbi:MAG: hypothetical protein FD156_2677 [Nitrospirae bacterium]|nr:MAG: hypothetical protein FD156_2677 [Nitrospirota bacterium]